MKKIKSIGIPLLNIGDRVVFSRNARLSNGEIIKKGTSGVVVDRNDPSGIFVYKIETKKQGVVTVKDWYIEMNKTITSKRPTKITGSKLPRITPKTPRLR